MKPGKLRVSGPRRSRRLVWVGPLLLVVTMLVLNGTWVFLYVHFGRVRDEAFATRLEMLADWARAELTQALRDELLDLSEIPWLDELPPETRGEIQARLADFAERNELARVVVQERRGDTLLVKLDTRGELPLNEENLLTLVDQPWVDEALDGGQAVATASYQYEDVPHMRAHTPLGDPTGEPVGVLTVEGQQIYFQSRDQVRALMMGTLLLVNAALIGLALLAHFALRRHMRLEEAMGHVDRLHALGTLAAGMAHEIRNPLGTIRITAETLRERLETKGALDAASRELFTDVLGEVDRVHDLIGRSLQLVRQGEHDHQGPAELIPTVQHIARLLRKTIGAGGLEVEIDPALNGAATPLPGPSLQQVLFNLIRNAIEAMEEAGRTAPIHVKVERRGEAEAAVCVSDRGVGMTPDQVRRAGQAFQSTKPHGTGLGLSISMNLLASVQGHLEIESRPGEGTAVTAHLPLIRTDPAEKESDL